MRPPDNKPTPTELNTCQPYLEREIQILQSKVIVCLGKIAFDRIRKIFAVHNLKFSHGAVYQLPAVTLICSYHPSQQNTFTGKLTRPMFHRIFLEAQQKLALEPLRD